MLQPKGIAVAAVCPGPVYTDMLKNAFGQAIEPGDDTPFGKVMTPDEVAPMMVRLIWGQSSRALGHR